MSNIDLSSFKGLYIQTSREYINKLRQDLEILLKDPQNYNAINAVHISAHSLTTQAAVTGYKNVEHLCIIIEKTFKKLKEEKSGATPELLSLLKDAIKSLSDCIDSIEKQDKEIDLSDINNQLESIFNRHSGLSRIS